MCIEIEVKWIKLEFRSCFCFKITHKKSTKIETKIHLLFQIFNISVLNIYFRFWQLKINFSFESN